MTHRRLASFAAVVALAIVLAACQITITPGPTWPPTFADTIEAQPTFNPTAQVDGSLAPGATRYFELDVIAQRDLVYAEAQGGAGLRVSIYSSGGTRLAVSEASNYFAGSIAALAVSAGELSGSSIAVTFPCLGPCVAVPSTAATYVVGVTNTSGSSKSFELFAYTFDETDENEPNDASPAAVVLTSGDTDQGAIEHLDDVDYFEYQATSGGNWFVVFDPFDLELGLELTILSPTCTDDECGPIDGRPGANVLGLLDGDVLRVRSSGDRAGPSATSGYSLDITSDPPVSSVSTR